MKKIGLVLCGCGAKGAYQVGVIRVLEEFGLLLIFNPLPVLRLVALMGLYFCNIRQKKWKISG